MVVVDFGDVKSKDGVAKLDAHFLKNSYVSGFHASQDDAAVLAAMTCSPSVDCHPNLHRWFSHIMSFSATERSLWPKGQGVAGCVSPQQQQPTAAPKKATGPPTAAKKADADDDDDDDFDPFGEETEEDKAGRAKMAEKAKEIKKPKQRPADKSTLVIEIKPNSTKTDLTEVEKLVRQIVLPGIEWSQSAKQLPIAFGLMKLQIGCTIVDELVPNSDEITDRILCVGCTEEESKKKIAQRDGEDDDEDVEEKEGDRDDDEEDEEEGDDIGLVQSAEIVSFNKL